ncbi:MAG: hypothetical protein K940chlam9_00725 [Chlamydiae bacterium]|nr:hypothetical protein [Chlamydiota bacterium]
MFRALRYPIVNLRTTFFRLFQWVCTVLLYYRNGAFFLTDCLLATQYFFQNPHSVSKSILKKWGAADLYTYGETPLTTLDKMARECQLLSTDTVFELGCGTGRTIFWLAHFVGCKTVGIDLLPSFIKKAKRVQDWLSIPNVQFYEQDMLEVDLSVATFLYLYGTCLSEEFLHKLVPKFEKLKPGTRILSVSYPLTEYSNRFEVTKEFSARFPWGKAACFLNVLL